jgi:hypothetical protein
MCHESYYQESIYTVELFQFLSISSINVRLHINMEMQWRLDMIVFRGLSPIASLGSSRLLAHRGLQALKGGVRFGGFVYKFWVQQGEPR